MNTHLQNKQRRYEKIKKSWCFCSNLIGLAAIELNISEMCSRRCSFCPRFNINVYKNNPWFMNIDTVRTLVEKCKIEKYTGDFTIAGFGEPMLNPNLPDIISHIGFNHTTLITNGDFLNENTIKPLISAGIHKIIVSCYDGPDASLKFKKLLEPSGIEWSIKELWGETNEVIEKNDFNSRTGLVPSSTQEKGKECYIPFYKLLIDWNGDAVLCSNDWYRKETNLGNVTQNSLKEIWMSDKLTSIRKNLMKGNRCDNACKSCNARGTLLGYDSFQMICSSISNT